MQLAESRYAKHMEILCCVLMKGGASCPHHWTPQMDLQMWPIYLKAIFAAHVLATLPATAMHKKYICHNSWAV